MSSCLGGGGGGRAYAFELEILKSPSPSPSSTLSESSNSGLAIATRKPRTPRKRPNQTYNEAAALLSTAYPKLFSAATVATAANSRTFSKSPFSSSTSSSDDSSELFFPFRIVDDDSTFLINDKPTTARLLEPSKFSNSSNSSSTMSDKSCLSPGEFDSQAVNFHRPRPMDLDGEEEAEDDFNYSAESILDEEIDDGGGINSIMGNLNVDCSDDRTAAAENTTNTCYGYPMGLGLGFELGFGIRRGGFVRALRHVDDANYGNNNWWSFPTVDMVELSPRFRKPPTEKKTKKKMKKVSAVVEREKSAAASAEEPAGAGEAKSLELPKSNAGLGLLLKLNYDGVLREWSDKGSPFSDDGESPAGGRNDVAVGSLSSSARKPKCRKEKEKRKK